MTNIRMALTEAMQHLKVESPEPRLDAEILLMHSLSKNRAYLYAHPDQILSDDQLKEYLHLIYQRARGIPIAYITGHREFWSLCLKVNPHTLIPRHETERLVELVIELLPDTSETHILDLGTGSGAVALAVATERPQWQITACDISIEALKIARENATNLGITNIQFFHSDWFKSLPPQSYHAILSNPPYIAQDDPHLAQGDIRFEPLSALASGQDGLADLQYIIRNSYNYLLPGGMLLMEHGFDQKIPINTIMKQIGYNNVHCWQDLNGVDRVSGGWRDNVAT
ncbi:MAG TPA: peptide chain release factor N(5)-glutamine methyltransferase [Legionella sp.]|nr:peptide chain release factor N(5)-glutamine methyltransferase [Legionella sp.]